MIAAAALALALGAAQEPDRFTYGSWQGQCFRGDYLAGMDHELCRVWTAGPVVIRIERSAEELSIRVEPEGCAGEPAVGFFQTKLLAMPSRAAMLTAMIRAQVKTALKDCRSKLKAPKLDQAAVAGLLLQTDGLAPGKKTETRP